MRFSHRFLPSILAAFAVSAHGQLIVGNDTANPAIWHIDLTGFTPPRAIISGPNASVSGLAADPNTMRLYWAAGGQTLVRADFRPGGTFNPSPAVTVIGPFIVNGANATLFTGLAFDSHENRLYGFRNSGSTTTEGFYDIDPATGVATLVSTVPSTSVDFGAFDYDSVTDAFYAVNDGSTGLPDGRGLYRISKPLSSPSYTFLAPSPNADNDIDGLAAGNNGRLYLVNDNNAQGAYVYNLGTSQFETPIAGPFGASGTFAGGALLTGLITADLSVAMTLPGACAVGVGQVLTIKVDVRNLNLDAAANVVATVILPIEFVLLDTTPASSIVGNLLQFDLGRIAPSTTIPLIVRGTFPAAATYSFTADAATTTQEVNRTNNTAAGTIRIGPLFGPTAATLRAIFSTVAANTSSRVLDPTFINARYSTLRAPLGRPFRSPSGNHWIMSAAIDTTADRDEVILIGDTDASGTGVSTVRIAAQEGVTTLVAGLARSPFSATAGITDDRAFAFGFDLAGTDTLTDSMLVKGAAATFAIVAREGRAAINAGPGVVLGGSFTDIQVAPDGRFSFQAPLTGTATSLNNAAFFGNAQADTAVQPAVLARKGVTTPTNQNGGTVLHLGSLSLNSVAGCSRTSTGTPLIAGTLANAAPGRSRVVVFGDRVVIQEDVPLDGSGFLSPVGASTAAVQPIAQARAADGDDWFAIGSNADDTDWIVRTGAVIAKTGDAILPGSAERWARAASGSSNTFLLITSNPRGQTLIAGITDNPNAMANQALVLDGHRLLARENDPVDLDGDGVFNDSLYIRSFDHRAFLGCGYALVVVGVRDSTAVLCGDPDIEVGQALMRIPLRCIADLDDGSRSGTPDGGVTLDDLLYFLDVYQTGSVAADVDDGRATGCDDGGVTIEDLLFFLLRFEAGC